MDSQTIPLDQHETTETDIKKYIRTFEGDQHVLESGGVPDLKLMTPTPSPSSGIQSSIPVAPVPVPEVPPLRDSAASAEIPVPNSDRPLIEQETPLPSLMNEGHETVPDSALKTYSGDFMDAVQQSRASTATILAAQQDAAPTESTPLEEKARSLVAIYSSIGVVLLLVAVGGIFAAYSTYSGRHAPVLPSPVTATPIPVDTRVTVSGTGPQLVQNIVEEVVTPRSTGTVTLLDYRAMASSTTGTLFSELLTTVPPILLRNIVSKGSMMGIVSSGDGQSPFFILSTASYGETFAGMLSWEPRLFHDLSPFLLAGDVAASTTPIAAPSTASATSSPSVASVFRDETIANHDVRTYRDSSGAVQIVYGYWNAKTLVIAHNTSAFFDILTRLASARTQPE